MKTVSKIILISLLFVGVTFAQFVGPTAESEHVQAKDIAVLNNDVKVVLTGKLVKKIYEEQYLFTDASGSVEVEIDNDEFKGRKVTPEMTIKITGEVSRENRKKIVEVDHFEIVQ